MTESLSGGTQSQNFLAVITNSLDALFSYVPLFRARFTGSRYLFILTNVSFLTFTLERKGDRHHPACVELKAFPQCLLEGKQCVHVKSLMVGAGPVSSPLVQVGWLSISRLAPDVLPASDWCTTWEPPVSHDVQGDRKPTASKWCPGEVSKVH